MEEGHTFTRQTPRTESALKIVKLKKKYFPVARFLKIDLYEGDERNQINKTHEVTVHLTCIAKTISYTIHFII